jgi:hypothetical protein
MIEVISWNRFEPFLLADGVKIGCWCKVRNELNGCRPRKEGDGADLFCATPLGGSEAHGPPSMPRIFPKGNCTITCVNPHPDRLHDGYLYPFWIGTDAKQELDVWELDDGGHYLRPSGKKIMDTGYGLHYSTCDWTQGCVRIGGLEELLWLVNHVVIGKTGFNVYEEAA